MSSTKRRGAFDPNALGGDIDSLLPQSPPRPTPIRPVQPGPAPDDPAPTGVSAPPVPAVRSARSAPPEAVVAPEVYQTLRKLTMRERQEKPDRARSYGQVVLDAVEAHAEDLASHWRETTAAPAASRLFRRVDPSQPRRRRHASSPARIPLAGIIPEDLRQLDTLAAEWGAGSRSALVEEALRRYLKISHK
ncbi:ribbon-helix-helix domain-containing protein [Hoyosella sp. YIM 151337]|uniref:CopG family ribbon-helix-helix protein n=1 Tax=Hoyosella sp. YIM 151337 TaxID=2992742 RepID=UPI0022360D9D|nr:ribbon-helix-helix domain-containing protein [Hoyosella sp. YIM 151337]MCW4354132.1 ribbon-helix-helix domain-containing protein [Hoyosella sp. YIM 151337]